MCVLSEPAAWKLSLRMSDSTPLGGLKPKNASIGRIRGDIQVSIRTVTDLPNALAELGQHHLLRDNESTDEMHAPQVTACQRADEEVAAPFWNACAGVERHPGRSDRRRPVNYRLFHARHLSLLRYNLAGVVNAVG